MSLLYLSKDSEESRQNTDLLPIISLSSQAHVQDQFAARFSKWPFCITSGTRVAVVLFIYSLLRLYCAVSRDSAHISASTGSSSTTTTQTDIPSTGIDIPPHIQRLWGQYSPYAPAGEYAIPPKGCNITQVNILQRHGARLPSASDAPTYKHAVHAIASAHSFSDSRLSFLHKYRYSLGEDALVPLGAAQSAQAGAQAWERYRGLITEQGEAAMFVRASDMERVVDSAGNWTQSFTAASGGRIRPTIEVLLSEEVNNTLHNDCPSAADGSAQMDAWLHHFAPPIARRLNKAAPGAHVSDEDVFGLMAMCPFESIARASITGYAGLDGQEVWISYDDDGRHELETISAQEEEENFKKKATSRFCDLFTEKEWLAFEFHGDVEKYYKTGPGNRLGPVQGVGYTNELLARLTATPVHDNTTHNASLPFPLHRALYADFSHENAMIAVYAAMNLFDVAHGDRDGEVPDPGKGPQKDRKDRVWVASRMVPFSARMVTERLECTPDEEAVSGRGAAMRNGTYVRILVNDALQPLKFCGGDTDGLCGLRNFVNSQGYAKRSGDGDFEKCYS